VTAAPRLALFSGLGIRHELYARQRNLAGVRLEMVPWLAVERGETLQSYARRLAATIDPSGPLYLGGVSFGDVLLLVQQRLQVPEELHVDRRPERLPPRLRLRSRLHRLEPRAGDVRVRVLRRGRLRLGLALRERVLLWTARLRVLRRGRRVQQRRELQQQRPVPLTSKMPTRSREDEEPLDLGDDDLDDLEAPRESPARDAARRTTGQTRRRRRTGSCKGSLNRRQYILPACQWWAMSRAWLHEGGKYGGSSARNAQTRPA
jgi:hypothetical protein